MGVDMRERPRCRKIIIEKGLRPYLDSRGKWDGRNAVKSDGSETSLSDGMRTEMRKMLQEGYWDNLAGDSPKRGIASRIGDP